MNLTYQEAMEIATEICTRHENDCLNCPLGSRLNGTSGGCGPFLKKFPDIAEPLLIKWHEEHKPKTFLDDFREKYPNAPINYDGRPQICPFRLGYIECCPSNEGLSCKECWNQIVKEEEKE